MNAYFKCTVGQGGGGSDATIAVSYDSFFYNKTITCSNGIDTYTQTTTSSGVTEFEVNSEGTWTITCNGITRTVDVVLRYEITMAITKNITIYSAANDTVSFSDASGSKTVTTDSSGQGNVSVTYIPNDSITFVSSVAKNPNDTTDFYSKTVIVESSTTEIKVMPDSALYWWGYNNTDAGNQHLSFTYNGATYGYTPLQYNTNSISGTATGTTWAGVSSKNVIDLTNYTKLNLYGVCDYDYTHIGVVPQSNPNAGNVYGQANGAKRKDFPTTLSVENLDVSQLSGDYWIVTIRWLNTRNHTIYALWLE